MKKFIYLSIFFTYLSIYSVSYQPSFTYPDSFIGEPRVTKDWLSTINLELRGGYAEEGRNGCKQTVNALNIYGCENFYDLAKGVPADILDCNPNGYINTLWQQTPRRANFGQVCVQGKFNLIEFTPSITQNFTHGLFLSLSIPIAQYSVKGVTYYDQTTKASAPTDAAYYQWQQFINNVNCNLSTYGLNVGNCKLSGLEDIQLFGGWSHSFENLKYPDFIDLMIALGINFPTGENADPTDSFCISLGYNGHYGFPLMLTASIGFFDWLTLGLNGSAMWFKNKTRCVEMKTDCAQQGWIHLAQDYANVKQGTIWTVSPFIKADHLIGGFSLTLSFSYDHQNQTFLSPCNATVYNYSIVNSDQIYYPWSMTAFHFILDFDFASFKHSWAPCLAFTIDKAISGKRIFKSAIFGATITCNFEW
ncbi:TPA: hypothetical protein DIC20_04545 [Candidatus Dependentiae bacterium]|nr:MAG: hypothetical protein US03_C0011G0009 [candidate division TM6 bacterium GW2011_GWF2_36_131]KKQ02651.1 MAG: hypothetical protein US13_C0012G0029 [candidate division TM6 bacterium GW2011_GWE2_36_25]HBR70283.1 hypothetical protein [Candidatus Dependentiae bacterium]HCU00945.1 hypothetical protein [Candidatus Dependentiae bacterium]